MTYVAPPLQIPDVRFPLWVVKKIGIPILTEADWNFAAFGNAKFGTFESSTGTVVRDTTDAFWGGAGSAKMTTAASTNDASEIKTTTHYVNQPGWLIAFEHKWNQAFAFGGTAFDFGIEPRDANNIIHARFRYSITTGEWKYQDLDLSYKSFPASIGGPLLVQKPGISGAGVGARNGYARCVVDPVARRYVGFEASGLNFQIETRDMRPLGQPMSSQGTSTEFTTLYFALVQAGANGAEVGYTTDWCISLIPPGVSPF